MSFDHFQRYKTIQLLVENLKRKTGLVQVSVLEIGSNGQDNLEAVLPFDRIQYSCLEIPEERKGDPRFIQLDGTDMSEIEDGSYDVVVALDVFEHVPSEKRQAFLKEAYRVASKLAILCFPFSNGYNERAEKRVNSYYRAIYGRDHIWLKEHIEQGLPNLDLTQNELKKADIPYSLFTHGDIYIWEEWMKALFGSYDMEGTADYLEQLEELYAEEVYPYDKGEVNYRAFLLLSPVEGITEEMKTSMDYYFGNEEPPENRQRMISGLQDLKKLCSRTACKQIKSFLYMDKGNGYLEEDKIEAVSYTDPGNRVHLSYQYLINDSVKGFRFDPVEGCSCRMSSVEIETDQGRVAFEAAGGWEYSGEYIFPGQDPQLLMQIEGKQPKWLKIEADLVLYGTEQTIALEMMDTLLQDNIQRAENAVREKEAALSARAEALQEKIRAEKERNHIAEKCQQAGDLRDAMALERDEAVRVRNLLAQEKDEAIRRQGELAREKDEALKLRDFMAREKDETLKLMLGEKEEAIRVRNIVAEEKDRALKERDHLKSEADSLRQELTEAQARAELFESAYQGMLNSASWKITAPLRKVFGKKS